MDCPMYTIQHQFDLPVQLGLPPNQELHFSKLYPNHKLSHLSANGFYKRKLVPLRVTKRKEAVKAHMLRGKKGKKKKYWKYNCGFIF